MPYWAIYQAKSTGGATADEINFAFAQAWYDNEWGYTCRLADLAVIVGAQL